MAQGFSIKQLGPVESDGTFKVTYSDGYEVIIDRRFDGQERPPCRCGCIDALIIKENEGDPGLWICCDCWRKRLPKGS